MPALVDIIQVDRLIILYYTGRPIKVIGIRYHFLLGPRGGGGYFLHCSPENQVVFKTDIIIFVKFPLLFKENDTIMS